MSSFSLRMLSHGAEVRGRCLDGSHSSVLENNLRVCAEQVGEHSLRLPACVLSVSSGMPIPSQAWHWPGRTHPTVVSSGQRARALEQRQQRGQGQVCESAISWPLRGNGGQGRRYLFHLALVSHEQSNPEWLYLTLAKRRWGKYEEMAWNSGYEVVLF